jgi:hypothetical protein
LFKDKTPDNVHLLGNGIKHAFPLDESIKDPNLFIYSSCPSRGLIHLLNLWPRILEKKPEARLEIFYNADMYSKQYPDAWLEIQNKMKQKGITYIGGVPHRTLHDAMQKSAWWIYPNEGEIETYCITAIKMQAHGVQPIVWGAGALPEVVNPKYGTILQVGDMDGILEALDSPLTFKQRKAMQAETHQKHLWSSMAERFSKIWTLNDAPNTDV